MALPREINLYYLYFSYALIIAIVVFVSSLKQQESKWWALLIFFSPVTASFYFLKTGAKRGIIPALITALIFAGICTGEYRIHVNNDKIPSYSQYPPVPRQIIRLSLALKKITNDLNNEITQLNQLSRSESSIENMSATIELIGTLKVKIIQSRAALKRLSSFLNDYKKDIDKDNFAWLLDIEKYYHDKTTIIYFKKLKKYLDTFEALLQYTFKNYNKISRRVPVALLNYDAYYLRYRGSMDDYNRIANVKVKFHNQFLKQNPKLAKFLPEVLHMDSLELKSKLQLWE